MFKWLYMQFKFYTFLMVSGHGAHGGLFIIMTFQVTVQNRQAKRGQQTGKGQATNKQSFREYPELR